MKHSPDEQIVNHQITGEGTDIDDPRVQICALRKKRNSLTTITVLIRNSGELLRARIICNQTGIELASVRPALSGKFFPEVTFLVEHDKGYTLELIFKKPYEAQSRTTNQACTQEE